MVDNLAPPHLPYVTKEVAEKMAGVMKAHSVVKKTEKVMGWSGLLGAYTIGELWHWFKGEDEFATLVPIYGMPYTISEEAFSAYLELSQNH